MPTTNKVSAKEWGYQTVKGRVNPKGAERVGERASCASIIEH